MAGQVLLCEHDEREKPSSRTQVAQNSVEIPTHPPQLGVGLVRGASSALASTYGAVGFTQVSCSFLALDYLCVKYRLYPSTQT